MQLVDDGVEDIEMGMMLEDFGRNVLGILGILIISGIASLIGALFFIIPGIYIAYKLSLAPVIFIVEEEPIGEALSKSWDATRDYWWFTFGMALVMGIIMNFASYIFVVPMYILIGIVSFSTGTNDVTGISTIISVLYGLSVVVPALLYCMPITSKALVYFNIQERKTGRSMMDKIESLGDQNTTA
jgi:phosphate/sulfate permease